MEQPDQEAMADYTGGPSPGSTIAASEMDDHGPAYSTLPDIDSMESLNKIIRDSAARRLQAQRDARADVTEDEESYSTPQPSSFKPVPRAYNKAKKPQSAPVVGTPTTNASIYTGNKIRHLKKDDGEPLWRKDIQYDFLKNIFENGQRVFTNSYDEQVGKQTFAELYIDAMAKSSKTSKILRDKLLSDHEPAKNMAMVCLLVNLGRMNTTLNFFPEMRAQLRTYHAIPSLQARQDPNSYKQLQDAPRLKSILKGASEDRSEPTTLQKIKEMEVPRTNPVNLIFVMAQFAPKVTELHFPPPRDFYDLIMRTSITSKSRATAFLWLMWHYLESDFTEEGAAENPFGPGVDYGQDVRNQGVPRFVYLRDEQVALENVDSPEEIEYGETKMKERKRIIEADQAVLQAEAGSNKRGPKPRIQLFGEDAASPASLLSISRGRGQTKYDSDVDSTRSTPPPHASNMRVQTMLQGAKPRGGASHKSRLVNGSSPIGPSSGGFVMNEGTGPRRARPLTAHQLAVERNRNQRVDHILLRRLRREYHKAKKLRRTEGAIYRTLVRMADKDDEFEDSEGDENLAKDSGHFRERGFRGLIQSTAEEDDFGEEIAAYAAAFRRMGRRLDRWNGHRGLDLGVMGTKRTLHSQTLRMAVDDETEDEKPRNGDDDLDAIDKEILGLGSDDDGDGDGDGDAGGDGDGDGDGDGNGEDDDIAEEQREEDDLNDVEKALLGLGEGDDGDEEDEDEDEDRMGYGNGNGNRDRDEFEEVYDSEAVAEGDMDVD